MSDQLKFCKTQQGVNCVIYKNNRYRQFRVKGESVYFRCTNKKCSSIMSLDLSCDKIVKEPGEHRGHDIPSQIRYLALKDYKKLVLSSLSAVPANSPPTSSTMSESVPGCSKSDNQAPIPENPIEMVDIKEEVLSNSSLNWDTPEPTQTLEQVDQNNSTTQDNALAAILNKIHEEMREQTNLLRELNANIQHLNQFVMANNNPAVLHGRPSVIRRENA